MGDRCERDGATLTWDPHRRVATLVTEPGVVLTEAHAAAFGAAVLAWVGEVPTAPYAFVVRGGDSHTTAAYRRILAHGATKHRDVIFLVYYGGTPETRDIAALYLRGVKVPGAVVGDAAAAAAALEGAGFAWSVPTVSS